MSKELVLDSVYFNELEVGVVLRDKEGNAISGEFKVGESFNDAIDSLRLTIGEALDALDSPASRKDILPCLNEFLETYFRIGNPKNRITFIWEKN